MADAQHPVDDFEATLARLDAGGPGLANPPTPAAEQPGTHAGTVAEWVRALALRSGMTLGPSPRALLPVIARWCEVRGWEGPGEPRAVGVGLSLAGVRTRGTSKCRGGARRPMLRRESAALLYRLVRAHWGDQPIPGEPRHRPAPRTRRAPERQRAPRIPFHLAGNRARAVVDSLGRVYPSARVAAQLVGGVRVGLTNVLSWGGTRRPVGPAAVERHRQALRAGVPWHGVRWRYLTPAEVAAVPPGTLAGEPLAGLAWGLACPTCGGAGVAAGS